MKLEQVRICDLDALKKHIHTRIPTIYTASKTSTVIPFELIEQERFHFRPVATIARLVLADLTMLPKRITLLENCLVRLEGAVTWEELRLFLKEQGLDLKVAPTDESASVLGGVATAASGERSFAFGNVRAQIVAVEFMDYKGEVQRLLRAKKLHSDALIDFVPYQQKLAAYHQHHFKNPHAPYMEYESDLMIGTEGQLGVIVAIEMEVTSLVDHSYFAIMLPRWEKGHFWHQQIFNFLQQFCRKDNKDNTEEAPLVWAAEFLDANSLTLLRMSDQESVLKCIDNFPPDQDVLFLEVTSAALDDFYDKLIAFFENENNESNEHVLSMDRIMQLPCEDYHCLRVAVPRTIQESNARKGVTKKGTDLQVAAHDFPKLLDLYLEARKIEESYLFGHFASAHLHFNFTPKSSDGHAISKCDQFLEELYKKIALKKDPFVLCSPFAEHGVGVLKKKFMQDFYGEVEQELFKKLKDRYDPYRQFFPHGFMSL
ncbi:MAG: FAD-binding oxidoreductase [Oligoflexia bacterium]|nr:FAD-binding oxidoreductase [Oligoflexia bacterium]MBF0366459.1 FAD-binding oxidoreductase [Oligoflexia bacterium]